MSPAFQFMAVFCTALFAGAAVYINLAEHPARMQGDVRAALAQWAPSYRRATFMQAPLAIVALLAALGTWALGAAAWWSLAGLLIGSVVPFTFAVIMPVNRALLAIDRAKDPADARRLLGRWGALHAARSVAACCALLLMLWQLCWPR